MLSQGASSLSTWMCERWLGWGRTARGDARPPAAGRALAPALGAGPRRGAHWLRLKGRQDPSPRNSQ